MSVCGFGEDSLFLARDIKTSEFKTSLVGTVLFNVPRRPNVQQLLDSITYKTGEVQVQRQG